jgi:hypothetical protein
MRWTFAGGCSARLMLGRTSAQVVRISDDKLPDTVSLAAEEFDGIGAKLDCQESNFPAFGRSNWGQEGLTPSVTQDYSSQPFKT